MSSSGTLSARPSERQISLAADRDEAWDLVEKAIGQMFGNLKIMTQKELQEKRLGSLGRDDVDTNAASA